MAIKLIENFAYRYIRCPPCMHCIALRCIALQRRLHLSLVDFFFLMKTETKKRFTCIKWKICVFVVVAHLEFRQSSHVLLRLSAWCCWWWWYVMNHTRSFKEEKNWNKNPIGLPSHIHICLQHNAPHHTTPHYTKPKAQHIQCLPLLIYRKLMRCTREKERKKKLSKVNSSVYNLRCMVYAIRCDVQHRYCQITHFIFVLFFFFCFQFVV